MKTILKAAKVMYVALVVAVILWGLVSWIDIIADNCMPNPQHFDWNVFVLLFDR